MSYLKIGARKITQLKAPKEVRLEREPWRGSRQERGYDHAWTKLRKDYYDSVGGMCEECRRRGYQWVCDVIDHMIPITDDPTKRLEWNNLDALCHSHHNGFKRKMEFYARKIGAIAMLPRWIKFPETRPPRFMILKRGPLADLFDAEDRERRDT